MRWLALCAVMAALPALASAAAERPVGLKQAPGAEIVAARCGACHSLDYIAMNSPFLDGAKWEAEVAKMIHDFGAPIDSQDAKTIVNYLKKYYGE